MNDPCRRIEEFLQGPAERPIPEDLKRHAAGCEACREPLALDEALRNRLDAGADLDPPHRRDLVEKILRAPVAPSARATAATTKTRRRWPWAVAAGALAAAAVLVLFVTMRPPPRESIRPTDVFADLLGPLPDLVGPAEEKAAPAAAEESSTDNPLAFMTGDWEGPLALGRAALEAPLSVVPGEKPAPSTDKPRPPQAGPGASIPERSREK
jgi:hypothetical protein